MNLERRDFLRVSIAASAAALADWRLFAASVGLPKYYGAYLAGIAARLKENAERGTPHGFFFVTDLHFARNNLMAGKVLGRLVEKTGITRVFGGGDYQAAFAGKEEPKAIVERLCGLYRTALRDPIEAAGGKFLSAKGNHDTHVVVSLKDRRGYTYSARETRDFLMDTAEGRHAVLNPAEETGMYYYVDDIEAKTRYIVADTSDGKNTAHSDDRGVNYGNVMRSPQLEWLEKVAFGTLPEGWHAVALQHIPFSAVLAGGVNKALEPCRRLFEAEARRGRLLFDIAGHHHCDRFVHWNGLAQLGVACDACYRDPNNWSPFSDPKKLEKTRRTVNEQAFDCIQFGGGLVRATRIGAGHDRTLHLKPLVLKTGESLHLDLQDLRGAVTWVVYDSDEFREDESGKTAEEICVFSKERATVSNEGTVTALRPGDVTVVAYDGSFNKEIFGVRIQDVDCC